MSRKNKKFIIESIVLVFVAIILGTTTFYNTDTNNLSPGISIDYSNGNSYIFA